MIVLGCVSSICICSSRWDVSTTLPAEHEIIFFPCFFVERNKAQRIAEKLRIKEEKGTAGGKREAKRTAKMRPLTPAQKEKREKNRALYRENRDAIRDYKHQYKLKKPTFIGGRGKEGPRGTIDAKRVNLVNANLDNPETLRMLLARFDYYMEERYFKTGGARYDFGEGSGVSKGDLHGFVHSNKKTNMVEFFRVTKVLGKDARRHHWDIEEHQERSVCVLSKYIGWAPWDKTADALGGFGSGDKQLPILRGTTTRKWNNDFEITMDGYFEG